MLEGSVAGAPAAADALPAAGRRRRRSAERVAAKIDSVVTAEHYARRRLPAGLAHRLEGGSGESSTSRRNAAALDRLLFEPRTAVRVTPSLSTTVAGTDIAMPVLIAPTGNLRVFHTDGEVGAARAARAAGVPMCLSSVTGTSVEEVAATRAAIFFQLYYLGERQSGAELISRAQAAGCRALIVTVDTASQIPRTMRPHEGRFAPSRADVRSAVRFFPQMIRRPRWTVDFIRAGMPNHAAMGAREPRAVRAADATASITTGDIPVWEDIPWIRSLWDGPLIIKGVLTADDARRAAAAGASAVVVSNHGGRLFDALPATASVLPEIVDAVGDEIEVLVDGGFRSGVDVARALALGARAVLIGRGYLWAHAAAGEAGVSRILEVYRDQLVRTMKLIGRDDVRTLERSCLRSGG